MESGNVESGNVESLNITFTRGNLGILLYIESSPNSGRGRYQLHEDPSLIIFGLHPFNAV